LAVIRVIGASFLSHFLITCCISSNYAEHSLQITNTWF